MTTAPTRRPWHEVAPLPPQVDAGNAVPPLLAAHVLAATVGADASVLAERLVAS